MTPINILVLCTGNSARSILAEALFNHLGAGRVRAYSAGSHPGGEVNPLALETLSAHGVPHEGVHSKSWDVFALPGAPKFDLIITVCDNAAAETCPIWPGHPTKTHWGTADPAHVLPMAARRAAFETAYQFLRARVVALLIHPLERMNPGDIAHAAHQAHTES